YGKSTLRSARCVPKITIHLIESRETSEHSKSGRTGLTSIQYQMLFLQNLLNRDKICWPPPLATLAPNRIRFRASPLAPIGALRISADLQNHPLRNTGLAYNQTTAQTSAPPQSSPRRESPVECAGLGRMSRLEPGRPSHTRPTLLFRDSPERDRSL